jgi:23S rRNA G2445 N2-methylase RlmL
LPADLIRIGVTDLASDQYLPPWKSLPEGPAPSGVRPRGMIIANPPYGERMSAGGGNRDEPPLRAPAQTAPQAALQAPPPDEPRQALRGRISLPVRAKTGLAGPGSHRRHGFADRPGHAGDAGGRGFDSGTRMPHAEVMARCGRTLQRWFVDWSIHLISTDPDLPRQLGLQADGRPQSLFNGAMACQFHRLVVAKPDAMTRSAEPASVIGSNPEPEPPARDGPSPAALPGSAR